MSILSWVLVGLVAGWLAGMVMRGSGYGLLGDILVGILGALVGGFLSALVLGTDFISGFNVSTLLVSFVGSVVLIWIVRAISGHPTPMSR